MKPLRFAGISLALLHGVAAESIIVLCGDSASTKIAKGIVEGAGGKLFYEYDIIKYLPRCPGRGGSHVAVL